MKTQQKLEKIMGLVYQLNKTSPHDWFFDFSGHIKCITIYYRKEVKKECKKCGTEQKTEAVYLAFGISATLQTGVNTLIKELEGYLK